MVESFESHSPLASIARGDDYKAMRDCLREHPANVPWQTTMDELLEVHGDSSDRNQGLPLVWERPKEPARSL